MHAFACSDVHAFACLDVHAFACLDVHAFAYSCIFTVHVPLGAREGI